MLTEADLQASIVSAARDFHWLCYHSHDSRRSEPGYPDLTLVRPPRVLFIECKTDTGRLRSGHFGKKGRWMPGQTNWQSALLACPGVEYVLARPSNLDEVYATLAAKEANHEPTRRI